ncbi:carotenoid cleavage dioxygenase 7, chloroplastic-like [Elaeis guineensis]|uniref:carotenoid cleavage dioxygenase 7, chloroplastic-like n=1 Tax=Elaeis guineensis var. tenera TaxID=51953 RepID=UPI003C6D7C6D
MGIEANPKKIKASSTCATRTPRRKSKLDCNFELKQKKEFVISDHLISMIGLSRITTMFYLATVSSSMYLTYNSIIHSLSIYHGYQLVQLIKLLGVVTGSLLALSGLYPMITALSVNPSQQSTPVYLLPRFSESAQSGRDWRVPIEAPPQLWSSHVGNAFEERDEIGNLNIQLQVSVCSYQWFNFQKMFGYNWRTGKLDPSFMNTVEGKEALLPHLVSVELDSTGACSRCTVSNASEHWNKPADFPVINPALSGQRNTYIYAGTASGSHRFLPHFPFDSIVKLNRSDGSATSWSAGSREFIGEPIFVPRGTKEDDGYILVVEYAVARQRCYLVVLDAERIGEADALVAKLEVPKHLTFPLGFHGFWADGGQ